MKLFAALAMLLTASVCLAAPPVNYTNDPEHDFEPTLVRARNAAGTWATVMVATKDLPTSPLIAVNSYVVKDGTSTYSGSLPAAAGKPWVVDPYLYPSQYSTGVAPYRLYCVGMLTSGTAPETPYDNSITVWRSDDLGRDGFANPALPYRIIETGGRRIILDSVNYEERTLDKPTIVVNGYGAYKGYVYVSYTRRSTIRQRSNNLFIKQFWSIYVARSTDGGDTWETPVRVWTNEAPSGSVPGATASHVVTANGNGYVYVTWVILPSSATTPGTIMLARSPSAGAVAGSWVVDSGGPTGYFRSSVASNGMQAMTVPVTRYNWVTNKIMVVWNERETSASTAKSDVYYAEKGAAGWTSWDGGVTRKLKISNESACGTTDQLRPALDFDSTGKATIVYYDRQNDCVNNDRYDVYYTQLTTSSTPASVVLGPTKLSTFTSDVDENGGRIGEYLDVWCESSVCYTAWIGTPNVQGDVMVSTIP